LSDLGTKTDASSPLPLAVTASTTSSILTGSQDQLDGLSKNAYERRIQRLEDEKKELIRKLENSNRALQKFAHGPIVDNDVAAANESNANEIRKLQDELNTMTKRNQDLESTMKQMESESKELTSIKRDLEFAESEKATKMKDFEKQTKTLKLEKEDLARDLTDAQEKLKLQSKELKDALQQRKWAMSEYTEVTDKYRVESRIADAMNKNRTLIKVGLKFQFNEPESRAAKALIANIDKRRVDRVREEGAGQNVKWKVPKTID
jgi:chromosome segregation ATPase